MAKRFTDTDKWKKGFIKELKAPYKLLWFYILDDCDVAGLWQVDMAVASLRIGFKVTQAEAEKVFGDKIIPVDNREKWFIPDFIEFQYGSQLAKTNNIYKSISKILDRYQLHGYLNVEITEEGTTISSYRNRVSQKVKDKIFLESEFICQYCNEQKTKTELVVDHFIPLKKGGDNSDDNLICSCARCNLHKSDFLPDEFLSRNLDFLKPTDKVKFLLDRFNFLKAPINNLLVGKDKEQVKEKDQDKEIPELEVFLTYAEKVCGEVGYNFEDYKFSITSKYQSWVKAKWKDGNGKPILDWKGKFRNTISYLKPLVRGKEVYTQPEDKVYSGLDD